MWCWNGFVYPAYFSLSPISLSKLVTPFALELPFLLAVKQHSVFILVPFTWGSQSWSLLSPMCSWGNWGTERLTDLPKTMQRVNGRVRSRTQVFWHSILCFTYSTCWLSRDHQNQSHSWMDSVILETLGMFLKWLLNFSVDWLLAFLAFVAPIILLWHLSKMSSLLWDWCLILVFPQILQ